jgi:hypothetical protein
MIRGSEPEMISTARLLPSPRAINRTDELLVLRNGIPPSNLRGQSPY